MGAREQGGFHEGLRFHEKEEINIILFFIEPGAYSIHAVFQMEPLQFPRGWLLQTVMWMYCVFGTVFGFDHAEERKRQRGRRAIMPGETSLIHSHNQRHSRMTLTS